MWGKKTTDNQGAVNVQLTIKKKKNKLKNVEKDQSFLPEMAFSPFGEATVIAEAFPMLSTGPRPTWLLKLRTCQPMTLANCWTA